jgi:hypothetical protein
MENMYFRWIVARVILNPVCFAKLFQYKMGEEQGMNIGFTF